MQKKLIALAVAGLASSAAFAQSNVTIYGIVDLAFTHSSAGPSSTSGIDSGGWSSSRIGFKGTEDLGDGLKAIFTLEYGSLTPDVSSGLTTSRQTWVGLQNATGSVKLGRQNTLGKDATDKYDPMASTTFSPLYALQRGNGIGSQTVPTAGSTIPYALQTVNGRFSNSIKVESANMSGFVFAFEYAYGGISGDDVTTPIGGAVTKKESEIAVGVDYTVGPLALNATHQRARDILDIAGNKASENFIGGSYDFGVAKLMGTFQTVARTQTGVKFDTDKLWTVGVQIPVTAVSKFYFGYAKSNDASPANIAKTGDNDSDSWGIQYAYELSKRTMLYTGYQRTSNDNAAKATVLPNTGGRAVPLVGGNATGYGFGIKHTF